MKSHQKIADKLAIGLSLACVLHCLALPIMLVLLPSLAALNLDNEAFHLWMVVAVLPSSIYALTMGCKQHKRYQLLVWGIVGLALLVLALALGEERIGEWGEKNSDCSWGLIGCSGPLAKLPPLRRTKEN